MIIISLILLGIVIAGPIVLVVLVTTITEQTRAEKEGTVAHEVANRFEAEFGHRQPEKGPNAYRETKRKNEIRKEVYKERKDAKKKK